MLSADDIVKFIICLWISFGLLAGLALIFDRFLISFIPKFWYITPPSSMLTNMLTNYIFFDYLVSIIHFVHFLHLYHISNKFLLILCTALVIILQITFTDQILPFNSKFNTKDPILQYIYPLWQTSYSD